MIAGIVLVAFGLEVDPRPRRRPTRHAPGRRPARRRGAVPARPRRVPAAGDGHAQHPALIAASLLLALLPVGSRVPALAAAAMTAAVAWAVVAYETWRYDEVRRPVRHHA